MEHLDDTVFESYDKQRMVMASRIVEFRGLNAGAGTVHAGFQDLAKIDHQRNTYRHLVDTGLSVHGYGAPAPGEDGRAERDRSREHHHRGGHPLVIRVRRRRR